ncbi:MAG: rRNA maturation RNase YbeY [Candidatus Goldiibacteriota bacterium]
MSKDRAKVIINVFKKEPLRIRLDIEKTVKKVIAAEKTGGEMNVNVIFAGDALIKRLNRQFRKKDKTTDVLTFVYDADDCGYSGSDIYISVPTARKDALEEGKTIKEKTAELIIHGVLHTLGYDHKTQKEYDGIKKLQEKYLKTAMRSC